VRTEALLFPAVSIMLLGCGSSTPPPSKPAAEFMASPAPAMRALPFSEAVRAGDFLVLSGHIGSAPGTADLVPGGIAAESKQAMENVKAILTRHGSSLDDVVKCTAFLADMGEWGAFNDVYRTYFPKRFPARSALGASGLAKGARVEVECVAWAPRPKP
jgi:2-iminobutanoate/2-iminopropanoate deaminase